LAKPRNRVRKAVERTVPFGLFCHSILILWLSTETLLRAEQIAPEEFG
jgi:hypothetical protein